MAKKIKVVLSTNEVFYLKRPWYYFWLFDGVGSRTYLDEDGEQVKIGNHWWIYQKNIEEALIPADKKKYLEEK